MEADLPAWAESARLILFHKQGTSARTLFLRHANGSVITPTPLPFLSTVLDEDEEGPAEANFIHPAALARDYCTSLGVEAKMLEPEGEFFQRVDTPGHVVSVYLVRFTCMDPPRALFNPQGGQFCAITELRGGHPAEMALLQKAYEVILG